MKHYQFLIMPLCIEAEDEEDARQQAMSMMEEGAWELIEANTASLESDNYGQLVIYTGLMRGPDGTLVDFIDEEER